MAALPPPPFPFSPPFNSPHSTDTTTSVPQQTSTQETESDSATSDTTSTAPLSPSPSSNTSTTSATSSTTTETSTTSSSVSSSTSSSSSSSIQTSASTTSSLLSSTTTSDGPVSTSSSTQTVIASPTPTPTLTPTTPATSLPPVVLSTSAGVVLTLTQTEVAAGATHPVSQDNSSSKGFFHNTGEVAGVFTAVGLVALVLIVALLTNAVRRRRAKKFDQDVAQAAAEAAAAGHAANFTDDDDYGYGANPMRERDTAERSYTGYSDNSHGTYAQQPLQPGESYNMNEFASFDPYVAAGAAGIGAAGVNRAKSVGRTQSSSPYHAFAGPSVPDSIPEIPNPFYDPPTSTGGYESQTNANQYVQRTTPSNVDDLVATGLSRNLSQSASAASGQNPSSNTTALSTASSPENHSYTSHSSPVGYPPNLYHAQQVPDEPMPNGQQLSTMGDDIYGGCVEDQPFDGPSLNKQSVSPGLTHVNSYIPPTSQAPRPVSVESPPEYMSVDGADDGNRGVPGWHDEDESRHSMRDEEDYGYSGGRRILKVANE